MLRILLFFVIVAALAFAGSWLADRPGIMTLDWQGYVIETSITAAALFGLVVLAACLVLWRVFRLITKSPTLMSQYFKGRKRDQGYAALSKGMIAVGAGDAATAQQMTKSAAKLLPNEPLTKLLTAQTAQLTGQQGTALDTFEAMTGARDTKLLGLRGLFVEAQRQHNAEAARYYAEEALKIAPKAPWAGNALFDFQCAGGDWDGALRTLQLHIENKMIDKPTARRRRAVLLTALAMELEDPNPQKALSLALEAHGLDIGFVPAATLAGRLSTRLGNIKRAAKVTEETWRKTPHPELMDAFARARPGDSKRDRLKRVTTLAQKTAHHRESQLAIAAAAIEAEDWTTARQKLEHLVENDPSVRVCHLMADLEDGETGNQARVRFWLRRAASVPRDPAWTADGMVAEHWMPVSPVTGRLDAFEWKVPVERMEPLALDAEIPEDDAPEDAPEMRALESDAKDVTPPTLATKPGDEPEAGSATPPPPDVPPVETDTAEAAPDNAPGNAPATAETPTPPPAIRCAMRSRT